MYQLKPGKEAFTAVEGPCKGRMFQPGKEYGEIPPGMDSWFTETKEVTPLADRAAKQASAAEVKSAPAKTEVKT